VCDPTEWLMAYVSQKPYCTQYAVGTQLVSPQLKIIYPDDAQLEKTFW